MINFSQLDFVILDVETTGFYPDSGDRIVELAAIKVKDLKEVEAFESFIDPERELSASASAVNGITSEMLIGAPKAKEVLTNFFQFVGSSCLVGHNVKFDLNFLNYQLADIKLPTFEGMLTVDTLKMAKELIPELGRHSLEMVTHHFQITEAQEHRALSDVRLTHQVFVEMIKLINEQNISSLEDFICSFSPYQITKQRVSEKIQAITTPTLF